MSCAHIVFVWFGVMSVSTSRHSHVIGCHSGSFLTLRTENYAVIERGLVGDSEYYALAATWLDRRPRSAFLAPWIRLVIVDTDTPKTCAISA